jgi:putative membrane protein (TIGR04086 family)
MNVKDITKNMVSERKTKEDSNFVRIIKGSILSIILTIICLLIFSLILAYTNIPEKTMIPVITAVTAISILAGSIISVSKIEKKGIINGTLVGLIYILTIYIISSIAKGNFEITINSIILIASAIIAGMLGGIIGVNIKNR